MEIPGKTFSGLDRLDPAEAFLWARRLKRVERPCGCKSGAALMLAALFGWPTWLIFSGIPREPMRIAEALLIYIAVVMVSAVVGKLAGIAVGRLRHRRLMHQFAHRLSQVASEKES